MPPGGLRRTSAPTETGDTPLNSQCALASSKRAQSVSMSSGVDLPFKSRHIGSFQYSLLEQSESFLPFTGNSVASAGAPSITANGLDGRVNTALACNVMTTRSTNDVKSMLRDRCYDDDTGGQPITVRNGVAADDTTKLHASTATPVSYNRQDAGADVTGGKVDHGRRRLCLRALASPASRFQDHRREHRQGLHRCEDVGSDAPARFLSGQRASVRPKCQRAAGRLQERHADVGWVVHSTHTAMSRSVWMQWGKPSDNVHLSALAFGVEW